MKRCRTILITSCKGGVGKSTVTANLGYYLAEAGSRVLLVDCDFSNRCLDLILGAESSGLYDISDVCRGTVSMSVASVADRRSSGLFSVSAPYLDPFSPDDSIPEEESFKAALETAARDMELDYILIDTPGALGKPLELASSVSDTALIVSTHHPTALRAADSSASALYSLGLRNCFLIINEFDADSVLVGNRVGIIEMIEKAVLPTIGIIPFSEEFAIGGEHGQLASDLDCRNVTSAFRNIAARISGNSVPLFKGWKNISRKKLLTR